jgi:hypothetical protein
MSILDQIMQQKIAEVTAKKKALRISTAKPVRQKLRS